MNSVIEFIICFVIAVVIVGLMIWFEDDLIWVVTPPEKDKKNKDKKEPEKKLEEKYHETKK